MAACDEVWLATGPAGRKRLRDPRVRKLCRLLGFGLLGVSPSGLVEVVVEPKPWKPRQDKRRRARLVDEHRNRIGDPDPGGSTRQPIMTAYRQQALACAASLAEGPRRTSELRSLVPKAPSILLRNVYGWFTRIERGLYSLTPEGALALARNASVPVREHRQAHPGESWGTQLARDSTVRSLTIVRLRCC